MNIDKLKKVIQEANKEKWGKELSKTFDKTIGTKFEIAENNFKAGQKKERENMIKVMKKRQEEIKKELDVGNAVRDINAFDGAKLSHKRILNVRALGNYQELEELIKALKDKTPRKRR